MKPCLIDTDILSEFFRGNTAVIKAMDGYLKEYGTVTISVISYYEILNGLLYKDAKKQLKRFREFAELNTILPLTQKATALSSKIYADLRKQGKPIGHTDTLIAGIAFANDLTLVTNNTTHFKRIKGLEISNWMKEV